MSFSSDQSEFEKRKVDHIKYALDPVSQGLALTGFEKIQLNHLALPEINFQDVSLNSVLLKNKFKSPHFISSMTAGHSQSVKLNKILAKAAAECGWLFAVGSQRKELDDSTAADEWRKIKEESPETVFVSNIGISELITHSTDKILQLVDSLGSVGIYIHLNPLQEVIQSRSNGQFLGGLKAIENLVKTSSVPVLIKEVGFGVHPDLISQLFQLGVSVVDLSGRGGTHWGMIEAARQLNGQNDLQLVKAFSDWGFTNIELLFKLQNQVLFNNVWASGGVRSGVDSAKCFAMGARAVGIAQPLMKVAIESIENERPEEFVIQEMNRFDEQLKIAMFCLGIKKVDEFLDRKVWTYVENY